jgi:hypothetical protein
MIAQFYFAQKFGIITVLPFVVVSIFNLAIWTLYLSTELLPQDVTDLEAITEH